MTRQHGIEFVAIDIQRQELSQCNQQTTEQIRRQADKLFTYQVRRYPALRRYQRHHAGKGFRLLNKLLQRIVVAQRYVARRAINLNACR